MYKSEKVYATLRYPVMTMLTASLRAWGSDTFHSTLKTELERLRSDVLPIAHVIGEGNHFDESDLGVIINEVTEDALYIYASVGVFFSEIVSCLTCSGGDGMCDQAYCEIRVTIDKASGKAQFAPL